MNKNTSSYYAGKLEFSYFLYKSMKESKSDYQIYYELFLQHTSITLSKINLIFI